MPLKNAASTVLSQVWEALSQQEVEYGIATLKSPMQRTKKPVL